MNKYCFIIIFFIPALLFSAGGLTENNSSGIKSWKKRMALSIGTGLKYYFSDPEPYVLRKSRYDVSTVVFINFGIFLSRDEDNLLGVEFKAYNLKNDQKVNGTPLYLFTGFFKKYYKIYNQFYMSPEITLSMGSNLDQFILPGLGIGIEYETNYFNFFLKNNFSLFPIGASCGEKNPWPHFAIFGITFKL